MEGEKQEETGARGGHETLSPSPERGERAVGREQPTPTGRKARGQVALGLELGGLVAPAPLCT